MSRAQRGKRSYSVSNVGHQHGACPTRETSMFRAHRGTLVWDINLSRAQRGTPACCVPKAGHQHVACPNAGHQRDACPTRDTSLLRAQRRTSTCRVPSAGHPTCRVPNVGTPTCCVPNLGHQPAACCWRFPDPAPVGGGQSIKLDHRSKAAGLPELAVSMP